MNKITFDHYRHPAEFDVKITVPETFQEKDLCSSLEGKRDIWVVLSNIRSNKMEAVNIASCFPKDNDEIIIFTGVYYSLHKLIDEKLVYTSKKGAERKAKLINKILDKEIENA